MLEISYTKADSVYSVDVTFNFKGLQPFRAQLFRIQLHEGKKSTVLTWDNRSLDCVGFPHKTFEVIADALEQSDLLGLRLPKEKTQDHGYVNLENKPDEWGVPNTIKIVKISDGDKPNTANYQVSYQAKQLGTLSNMLRGNSDGEVRELLIAAIRLLN